MNAAKLGVPGAFFVLALWFFFAPEGEAYPRPEAGRVVSAEDLSTDPLRVRMTEPPAIGEGAYRLQCQECHKLFKSNLEVRDNLNQHEDLVLNHGMNSWCFNCHSVEDRNKLVIQGGEEIGYDRVEELCAKCHGTVYRDWERGTHGRTNGFWDSAVGEPDRLVCVECHDPHSPAYPGFSPLPGPNTLRMGERKPPTHDEHKVSPLMRWQNSSDRDSSSDSEPENH